MASVGCPAGNMNGRSGKVTGNKIGYENIRKRIRWPKMKKKKKNSFIDDNTRALDRTLFVGVTGTTKSVATKVCRGRLNLLFL